MSDTPDENPKAFKHWYTHKVVGALADRIRRLDRRFDSSAFTAATATLETLELKARVALIADALAGAFKRDFPASAQLIVKLLEAPLEPSVLAWPLAHFVGRHGLAHRDAALAALYAITQRFTAEFDIRHFLLADPVATLKTLRKWARDPSEHVRRLVSEGTRTRLPWGIRLQPFIDDPTPVLPLLDVLHDDPSEYVRRSVANNLNDLAKDHPELVVERILRWGDVAASRSHHDALARRALRTLIKQGHPGALAALGVAASAAVDTVHFAVTPRATIGESIILEATLANPSDDDAKLVVDFALHYRSANDTVRAPKVFKWKTFVLAAHETVTLTKQHPMRDVSIRRLNPGVHRVDLLINGTRAASADVVLAR